MKKPLHKRITGWRLWLFRVIAVIIIPTLLFGLVEVGLRIGGYGYPTGVTVKCKFKGKDAYCSNLSFGWRFWPRNLTRNFTPFVIPADKPADTYRIFVMGSSAALGTPDPAFSFSRFLKIMLQKEYPQTNFEVINTAMTAVNSHVVLEIAKDCAKHKGDLFIVYMGNNEIIGPYGAGTIFAPLSDSLAFIRFDKAFKSIRLGQLLTYVLKSRDEEKKLPETWLGTRMFMDNLIRQTDANLKIVYRNFQKNLEDIARVAGKSGAQIIFSTVACNLKDCPPFASLHRPDLTGTDKKKWDAVYQQGIACESAGNYAEAVDHYLEAGKIDDSYAELQFRLARCYWAMDKYDQAREKYSQACDLDTLRLRADSQINDIIRRVAAGKTAKNIYFADSAKMIAKNSPHETPGKEFLHEHVHFNFDGNYLLAKIIFENVAQILPQRIKNHKANKPLATMKECQQRLAYTDWTQYISTDYLLDTFIKQPPFSNRLDNDKLVSQMEQKVKTLKASLTQESLKKIAEQYRRAIQISPEDGWLHWQYAKLLDDTRNYQAAIEQYRLLLECWPNYYIAHGKLALLLLETKQDANASITYSREALRINPAYTDAYYSLAVAYDIQGQIDQAEKYYNQTLELDQRYAPAWNNLAVLCSNCGRDKQAEQIYRKGLQAVQDYEDLYCNLAILLNKQGRRQEALEVLRNASVLHPDFTQATKILNNLAKKRD